MSLRRPLPTPDLAQHPARVAPQLLGCVLVGRGASGIITEVEAYHHDDAACHGYGRTPTARTQSLFGPAGRAYVYFTYGMHWCTNIVTAADGEASAVLIRALHPVSGIELMRTRRSSKRSTPCPDRQLTYGPACVTQALGITSSDDGISMIDGVGDIQLLERDASLLARHRIDPDDVTVTSRIGISRAIELPWRFVINQRLAQPPA